jgi:hypothetical protein
MSVNGDRNGNGHVGADESGSAQMARLPWYPRDFASSTRGWPLVARGAYREALDAQWDLGSLPGDAAALRALVGATAREWSIAWPLLEPKLPLGEDGRRRNGRLESHRRKALQILQCQKAGAQKGNRTRWGNRQ